MLQNTQSEIKWKIQLTLRNEIVMGLMVIGDLIMRIKSKKKKGFYELV